MANETAQGGDRASSGTGLTGMRIAGVRPCPSCTTLISVHATVCPNCGENVAIKEKSVRCRRCGGRASSNLVICPHCGRDLQPATTRWLTWGIPLLVALLLVSLLFVRLSRGNLGEWTQAQSERMGRLVESLTSRIQPELSVALIPPGQDPNDPLVSQAALSSAETGAGATVSNPPNVLAVAPPPADTGVQTATVPTESDAPAAAADNAGAAPTAALTEPAAAVEPTATETATAAATATTAATATAPATATALPTPTAAATATAQATDRATVTATVTLPALQAASSAVTGTITGTLTGMIAGAATQAAKTSTAAATPAATPTAAATATPTSDVSLLSLLTPTPITGSAAVLEVYTVRRGDTLFDIATQYDLDVDELVAFNNLTEEDVYTIQPGDELNIPAPTPVGAPTATPGPTPASYTVRPGDTISEIARALGVTMDELMEANGLTINDARTLQPGDVLLLPGAELTTPTPAPTATAAPAATPTTAAAPTLAAAQPLTATAASALRLDAPKLRSPASGAALSCKADNTLSWLAVPNVRATDVYLVHLGYVNSIDAGGEEEIIWVLTQQQPASATFRQLDNDFCGLAPATQGKQWRWYVEVAEKTANGLQPVSPASTVWEFTWQ